jgi:phospholipid transport system substrate-binding protein
MRVGLVIAVAVGIGLATPAAAGTAREAVEATVAQVLEVLRQPDESAAGRRTQIEQIAYARFDFDTMGRLVLARNWKRFNAEQRDGFITEFKRHLSRSYGTRISRYEQEKLETVGERQEKRGDVTVLTVIRGGQLDGAVIDYRMRERDGEWRVIDVIIEGVSLVSNFRSQFRDIVSKQGPDGLIAQLKARNDESASLAGVP